MKNLLLAMLGGALGTGFRYGIGLIADKFFTQGNSAWITLGINFLGSLILGCLLSKTQSLTSGQIVFFTIGICGGFTTFSSFSKDVFLFISEGNYFSAISLLLLSVVLGVSGFALGNFVMEKSL